MTLSATIAIGQKALEYKLTYHEVGWLSRPATLALFDIHDTSSQL